MNKIFKHSTYVILLFVLVMSLALNICLMLLVHSNPDQQIHEKLQGIVKRSPERGGQNVDRLTNVEYKSDFGDLKSTAKSNASELPEFQFLWEIYRDEPEEDYHSYENEHFQELNEYSEEQDEYSRELDKHSYELNADLQELNEEEDDINKFENEGSFEKDAESENLSNGNDGENGDDAGYRNEDGDDAGYRNEDGDNAGYRNEDGDDAGYRNEDGDDSGYINEDGDDAGYRNEFGDDSGYRNEDGGNEEDNFVDENETYDQDTDIIDSNSQESYDYVEEIDKSEDGKSFEEEAEIVNDYDNSDEIVDSKVETNKDRKWTQEDGFVFGIDGRRKENVGLVKTTEADLDDVNEEKVNNKESDDEEMKRETMTNLLLKFGTFQPMPSFKHRLNVTLEQYKSGMSTGNPLIDNYGENNLSDRGEMGNAVVLTSEEETQAEQMIEMNLNTVASDVAPLNRLVPDSRLQNCDKLVYNLQSLPTASIIIPFHNEWPSLLLRTVYSVVNRSPRPLIQEIILVDDASTLGQLQKPLEDYIEANFPQGLVRLIRHTERLGLIKARMSGCRVSKGDVLIFFDSHMEVNIDWLPPLLSEIARDNTVVAMATLDYIQADDLSYKFYKNYLIRYGWNWRLGFYELYFREDQIGPDPRKPRPGPTMVGAAFAIDKNYFFHLGGYDESMSVWGGENLEMGWRVWQCGGRLMHVPCSRIGHVPRSQPYSFPGGREQVEHFNYKRAISVWMGNYSRYVYSIFPDMKTLDVGDIADRLELKSRLKCQEFGWYLENIWPELAKYDEKVTTWGQVKNKGTGLCMDNNNDLYQDQVPLYLNTCNGTLDYQAFALTQDNLLQTSLSCVVCQEAKVGSRVKMEDCIIGSRDQWIYTSGVEE
ncbi:Polypeptide N-acetylgalactosaminyltransferase 10 [Biomphalaria glabrata]